MIKLKNYIVVRKYVENPLGRGFEGEQYRLGVVGDCFNTFEEARAYAKKISQKCDLMPFGEIFYDEDEEPQDGELPVAKEFFVVQQIDTVTCTIDTVTDSFLVEMNNFHDNRLAVTVDERSIMNFLSQNRYIHVNDAQNEEDFILNTRQITAIHL